MERRNFLLMSGILTASLGIAPKSGISRMIPESDPLKPVLLPSLPPLDHKGGMDIRVWIRSSMTNGVFSNVECAVAPGIMGPPPHYHKELDEIMYVAEGTASVLVGNDIVEVQAGGWHLRPRMIKHTFWNSGDKPLRFFDLYFNQPFEDYLEEIFHKLTEENGFKDGSETKNQAISTLNEKFGLVFSADAFDQKHEIMKQFGLK